MEGKQPGKTSQSDTDPTAAFLAKCKRALSPENEALGQPKSKKSLLSSPAELPLMVSTSSQRSREQSIHQEDRQASITEILDLSSETEMVSLLTPPATEVLDAETHAIKSSEFFDPENKDSDFKTDSSDVEMSNTNHRESETGSPPEQLKRELLKVKDLVEDPPSGLPAATIGSSFEKLDKKEIQNVLRYLVNTNSVIYPFYKQGMIDNRDHILDEEESPILRLFYDRSVIHSPNIDLSFLRISKTFYQIGSDLFYGSNRFKFYEPDACS